MDLIIKIITILNLISLVSNLINISYSNFAYRIIHILIIILTDKNINKFACKLLSIFNGILNNLYYMIYDLYWIFNDLYWIFNDIIIINIQFFFWIGFFSLIYYFTIE